MSEGVKQIILTRNFVFISDSAPHYNNVFDPYKDSLPIREFISELSYVNIHNHRRYDEIKQGAKWRSETRTQENQTTTEKLTRAKKTKEYSFKRGPLSFHYLCISTITLNRTSYIMTFCLSVFELLLMLVNNLKIITDRV